MSVYNNSKLKNLCIYGFYPLWILEYFLMFWNINLNKFIGLPIMVLITFFVLPHIIKKSDTISKIVRFFLFYNIISFFWFVFSDIPMLGYTTMLKYFVFPMLFYWIGRYDNDLSDKFYKSFLWSMMFVFIVGLIWYFTTPSYYLQYVIKAKQEAGYLVGASLLNETSIINYLALTSFMDIYSISLLCVPAMGIAYGFAFRKHTYYNTNLLYFFGAICLIVAFLTYQRIALFCGSCVFVFFAIWSILHKKNKLAVGSLILLILLIFVGFSKFGSRIDTISEMLNDTIDSLSFSKAMEGGRRNQYKGVLSIFNNVLIGSGMGSAGSVARLTGHIGVTDGEYIRIIVENGLIGAVTFIIMVLKTIPRLINNINKYLIETIIIVFFLVASIGANALSLSTIIAPIFWYALGKVYNQFNQNVMYE